MQYTMSRTQTAPSRARQAAYGRMGPDFAGLTMQLRDKQAVAQAAREDDAAFHAKDLAYTAAVERMTAEANAEKAALHASVLAIQREQVATKAMRTTADLEDRNAWKRETLPRDPAPLWATRSAAATATGRPAAPPVVPRPSTAQYFAAEYKEDPALRAAAQASVRHSTALAMQERELAKRAEVEQGLAEAAAQGAMARAIEEMEGSVAGTRRAMAVALVHENAALSSTKRAEQAEARAREEARLRAQAEDERAFEQAVLSRLQAEKTLYSSVREQAAASGRVGAAPMLFKESIRAGGLEATLATLAATTAASAATTSSAAGGSAGASVYSALPPPVPATPTQATLGRGMVGTVGGRAATAATPAGAAPPPLPPGFSRMGQTGVVGGGLGATSTGTGWGGAYRTGGGTTGGSSAAGGGGGRLGTEPWVGSSSGTASAVAPAPPGRGYTALDRPGSAAAVEAWQARTGGLSATGWQGAQGQVIDSRRPSGALSAAPPPLPPSLPGSRAGSLASTSSSMGMGIGMGVGRATVGPGSLSASTSTRTQQQQQQQQPLVASLPSGRLTQAVQGMVQRDELSAQAAEDSLRKTAAREDELAADAQALLLDATAVGMQREQDAERKAYVRSYYGQVQGQAQVDAARRAAAAAEARSYHAPLKGGTLPQFTTARTLR